MPETPRVAILSGFLGSGKTTMLRHLLRQNAALPTPRAIAVLVNDLSELDVDGEIVAGGHCVSEEAGTLVRLSAGSLSGNLLRRAGEALDRLLLGKPELILIETSGSNHPWPLIGLVAARKDMVLQHFIALADGAALHRDYANGALLAPRLRENEAAGRRTAENLLVEQAAFADVIFITKTDRLPPGAAEEVAQALHALNPRARLHGTVYGEVPASAVWDGPAYDIKGAEEVARHYRAEEGDDAARADPATYDIGATVVYDTRPFHPQRLWEHFNGRLGLGIHRSKGFLWMASRPGDVFLWNQAGASMGLESFGRWKAAILREPAARLLPEERAWLEDHLRGKSPVFGDRHCELTVIGAARDREIFVAGLKECFCNEDEVEQWQAGMKFDDPWPTSLKRR